MKILYLSCHSILAYDECLLLQELGHEVFCPDSFVEKANPGDPSLRPQLEVKLEHLDNYRENMRLFHACGIPGKDNKENLSVELLKKFDIVIVMHIPRWITLNWERFKQAGVKVIWRTIGQSWMGNENELKQCRNEGLKIVRYSPREQQIPGNNGCDYLIRFYKDPDEFCGWNGNNTEIVAIVQSIVKREGPCNLKWLDEVSKPFARAIYGAESEQLPWGKGKLPFENLKKVMRDSRVFMNGGTFPASYTLSSVEAWMTGVPLICVGPEMGHPYPWFGRNHPLYEWGDLITNGENGWCSDDMAATHDFIKQLMSDHNLARKIGDAGRKKAIECFGKGHIKERWKNFLDSL